MFRLGGLLLCAALLYLVVQSFVTTRSSTAYRIAQLRVAQSEPAVLGPRTGELSAFVLRTAPLDSRSYFALSRAAEQGGDADSAERLARQAISFDPRLRWARLWLGIRMLSQGRIQEGIAETEALMRVGGDLAEPVSALLAQIAAEPGARAVIAQRFGSTPQILHILDQAARLQLPPQVMMELLGHTDLRSLPNGVATAQPLIAEAFIRHGQYQAARAAWARLGRTTAAEGVYDGGFRGQPGGPPFNWALTSNTEVSTSVHVGGGPGGSGFLRVESFGELPTIAAQQTLVLRPGQYRLQFASSTEPAAGAAGETLFEWTVKCASRTVLAQAPVTPRGTDWRRHDHQFTVPANCPVQTLSLEKRSGSSMASPAIRISAVAVAPLR